MKQSPMPPRRTPVARSAPIGRGTAGLSRAVPVKVTRRSPIPASVRKLVLERDGYACVCCGRSIIGQRYSLGHRLRASQGGLATPSNLLTFLGWGGELCHGRIDSRRDPADEAKGYTVRSFEDPAMVPVLIMSPYGSGAMVWLTADGRYSTESPDEVTAA